MSRSNLTPICARLFCAICPILPGPERVEEHVADHQLAAVLLAELAVEPPAQRVEFLLGLLRVEGDRRRCCPGSPPARRRRCGCSAARGCRRARAWSTAAMVLRSMPLATARRSAGSSRIVPGAPLNVKWYQDRPGARRIVMPAGTSGDLHLVERRETGGVDRVVLQRRDARGVVEDEVGDAVQAAAACPTISGCAST